MHTLYPFRDAEVFVPRRRSPPFPVFTPVPPDIDFVALEQAAVAQTMMAPATAQRSRNSSEAAGCL